MKLKTQSDQYVSRTKAAEILGVGSATVKRFADDKRIGTRTLPGLACRYKLADVLRLAESSTSPAMATETP